MNHGFFKIQVQDKMQYVFVSMLERAFVRSIFYEGDLHNE